MPPARKRAPARPRTTPAPKPSNPELEAYKEKVAKEVKHYKEDTGDLCNEEYTRLREALDLGHLLAEAATVTITFNGDWSVEGLDRSIEDMDGPIERAILEMFEKGVSTTYNAWDTAKQEYVKKPVTIKAANTSLGRLDIELD